MASAPFPQDFSTWLTPKGQRLLAGRGPLVGALAGPKPFVSATGLIDPHAARAALGALDAFAPELEEMALPIPEETITKMEWNYGEWLPKTGRVMTAYLDSRRARAWKAAEALGLVQLLHSPAVGKLAATLAGRPVRKHWGIQVLCYRPGDYAGPHNDHHPEEPAAKDGYLDLHFTLCTDAVADQQLVYAEGGHLSGAVSVRTLGGLTAYRLPFWHYTTPLTARRGREAEARRWVLLATFLFAAPDARPSQRVDPAGAQP